MWLREMSLIERIRMERAGRYDYEGDCCRAVPFISNKRVNDIINAFDFNRRGGDE